MATQTIPLTTPVAMPPTASVRSPRSGIQTDTTINYVYYSNGSTYDPHYLVSITDERGNKTIHIRDPNTHLITGTQHLDANNNLLAYEEFQYNNFGQLTTHHLPSNALKNGAYVHYQYNNRGLLIKHWNPTTTASYPPPDTEPHTTYTYLTSGWWLDRMQTMTLPANVNGLQASETYEYDKNAAGNPVPGGAAWSPRSHITTRIDHSDHSDSMPTGTGFGRKTSCVNLHLIFTMTTTQSSALRILLDR